ncbi:MAG: hypothetical protein NTV43_09370 [Methylococcales bacterium]|nr:hypothetical protein [Methylococcales bacterium]
MSEQQHYLNDPAGNAIAEIVKGIDRDVERGEDVLMLGLGTVMLSSTFAPVAPPSVLLPLVALVFALSASYARFNYHGMERKLKASMALLKNHEQTALHPVSAVFTNYPMEPLADSFNPLKNLKRTWKSVMGGILINPFWMPIFYVMGMQIVEERNLGVLNEAIISVEKKLVPPINKE